MNSEGARPLVDAVGLFGNLFEYACVIALGSSTILIFLYLWRRGSLGYDEEAAQEMVNQDELYTKK